MTSPGSQKEFLAKVGSQPRFLKSLPNTLATHSIAFFFFFKYPVIISVKKIMQLLQQPVLCNSACLKGNMKWQFQKKINPPATQSGSLVKTSHFLSSFPPVGI